MWQKIVDGLCGWLLSSQYKALFGKDARSIVWNHRKGIRHAGRTLQPATFERGDLITITLDYVRRVVVFFRHTPGGTLSFCVCIFTDSGCARIHVRVCF